MRSTTILVVEDNEDDAFFMTRVLREMGVVNPVQIVEDGQQAVDYLAGKRAYADRSQYPLPMIVFLDLKLPFISGHDVLGWIRRQPEFEKLVVVVLTSSNEPIDLTRAYRAGANSYIVKPPTPEQLSELAKSFNLKWVRQEKSEASG
jgi:CheY-like chemotaxis protein